MISLDSLAMNKVNELMLLSEMIFQDLDPYKEQSDGKVTLGEPYIRC